MILLCICVSCTSNDKIENSEGDIKNGIQETFRLDKISDTIFECSKYKLISTEHSRERVLLYITENAVDTLFRADMSHCDNVYGTLRMANENNFIWENGACGSGNRNIFYLFANSGNELFKESGLIFSNDNVAIYTSPSNQQKLICVTLNEQKLVGTLDLTEEQYMDYYFLEAREDVDGITILYDKKEIGTLNVK